MRAILRPSIPFVASFPRPKDPRSQRLWTVAQVLKASPFSDAVQELNTAQMDWILEMHAAETPGVTLERPGELRPEAIAAAWSEVLLNDGPLMRGVSQAAIEAAKKLRAAHRHPGAHDGTN